ncbi:5152_t:CDS:2, partial [Racocetra persica]
AGYSTLGVDIDKNSTASYKGVDFLKDELFHPPTYKQKKRVEDSKRLFICNPPFNRAKPKLAPEEMPIVLFVPMGFRLNPKKNGKRWGKFIKDAYPPISSIISLPRDIFPN